MTRKGMLVLVLTGALATSLASSFVRSHVRVAYPGSMDCRQGCEFVAGGWPFRYLVDQPGISPAGSVSLSGGLLGVDVFRSTAFGATVLFWILAWAAAAWMARRMTRPGGH